MLVRDRRGERASLLSGTEGPVCPVAVSPFIWRDHSAQLLDVPVYRAMGLIQKIHE